MVHGGMVSVPKGLGRHTLMASFYGPVVSLFGYLQKLIAVSLSRCTMFLSSWISWSFYCSLGFTFIASYIALSGLACRHSDPVTCCLDVCVCVTQFPLTSRWMSQCPCNVTLVFCIPANSASHGYC